MKGQQRNNVEPLEYQFSVGNFSTDTDDELSLYSTREEELAEGQRRRTKKDADLQDSSNLLRKDNRIRLLRAAALQILILAGILVSLFTYTSLRASEQREFETRFWDQGKQIGNALKKEMQSKLQIIDSLSVTTTSYANSKGRSWPNITIPEFSYRAASTLTIARGIAMALQPVVTADMMEAWESYAVKEQRWITSDIAFQELYPSIIEAAKEGDLRRRQRRTQGGGVGGGGSKTPSTQNRYNVSEFVFHVQDGVPQRSERTNLALPLWQHSPVLDGLPYINYDVFEIKDNQGPISEVLDNQQAAFGLIYELADSVHGYNLEPIDDTFVQTEWSEIWGDTGSAAASGNQFQHVSMIGDKAPTLEEEETEMMDSSGATVEETTMYTMLGGPAVNIWYPVFGDLDDSRDVVAVLSMTTKWESFLLPNLPPDPNGLVVVIWNECDQAITFDITGTEVTYLGPGDLHEPEYDDLKQTHSLDADISTFSMIRVSTDFCPYKATVYPSSQMREEFESTSAVAYTVAVATIFAFAIAVFCLYDYLVERRQKFLAETAHKSSVIVSGLFPRTVRDRLYEEKNGKPAGSSQFLTSANKAAKTGRPDAKSQIADVYSSTTVMFGDIAGFTKWSSTRQPSEVFELLETLYAAFDKIAKRMDVFKVEVIGDCYMAVTGLPTPQPDHCIRMVRFARKLLYKTSLLTKELEATLGPDTGNLSFRIGLHSGPVTAGVLRGEKGRYQLFGDTVNTASRMESTGVPNRIQVSQISADLIAAANKSHWLKKRDEMVEAKGKGKVQTYWVKAKTLSDSVTSSTSRTDDRSSLHSLDSSQRNDDEMKERFQDDELADL